MQIINPLVGHSTFFGFINTFVHCVIYTYLVTIAIFPKTKNTIFFWWKPFYPYFQVISNDSRAF